MIYSYSLYVTHSNLYYNAQYITIMLINIELYAYMYRNTVNVQCHGVTYATYFFSKPICYLSLCWPYE